ncbi:HNH endonuclease [Sphingomonas sp. TZW2008]|uniref:HNH endonuclease n=1 Tax=Sphingomonas sp. TZW2008 TaxID=1917973 RepID=UPI0011818AFF|nr:HNH endonuclease [Sphingomonas sp. TZW2008]
MGRVSRKLGLIDAAARADAAAAPLACALCDRPLGSRVEWHHVVPKSEGGTETQPVHPICHRTIHAAADNATLARIGELSGIRAIPTVARFLTWIADKPPDFHAPTRRTRAA